MATETHQPQRNEYQRLVKSNPSLAHLFLDKVRTQPDSPAVIENGTAPILSYLELHERVLSVAAQLHANDYPLEEPTGVLVAPGLWNIITQVAVVYAGGTLVPLYPEDGDDQLSSKLSKVGGRYLLVDECNKHRLRGFTQIILEDCPPVPTQTKTQFPIVTTLDHRTHILFTSGTTGEPKGVQMSARSLLHICYHVPNEPLKATDVMAHYIPMSFDYTFLEIWAPLLVGARIAILPYTDIFDGNVMEKTLRREKVTVIIIVTALLNVVSYTNPSVFSSVRMVLFGGDAASASAVSRILSSGGPPTQLINAYGPTETTCYSLTHELSMKDVHSEPVSIGNPTGDTVIHILDEHLRPVTDGQVGELFIGGPGVSRGYLNQQEKNDVSFVHVNDLPDSPRLYRTGDLVRRSPASGQVYYHGRQDHQVVIFTLRVELAAVKAALMKTGRFADAVALAIPSPITDMGNILVTYVVPSTEYPRDKILDGIEDALQPHMYCAMPHIQVVDQFPLNVHFKIDRKELAARYLHTWEPLIKAGADNAQCTTEQKLAHVWAGVLAMPNATFKGDDDFFVLSRDVFQGVYLVQQIRVTMGVQVLLRELEEN